MNVYILLVKLGIRQAEVIEAVNSNASERPRPLHDRTARTNVYYKIHSHTRVLLSFASSPAAITWLIPALLAQKTPGSAPALVH